MSARKRSFVFSLLLLGLIAALLALPGLAQDSEPVETPTETPTATATPSATPTNTAVPPLRVTGSEPQQIPYNQGAQLTVFGSNFTAQTTVRLVGFGLLDATLVHGGAITAAVPSTINPGVYDIEVSDPLGGTMRSPNRLTVLPPPPPTMQALPTITPVPGAPRIVVTSYSTNPLTIEPGGTLVLNMIVANQGTRPAQAIVITAKGTRFVPAGGQASVTVANLPPGSTAPVTLALSAAADLPGGPINITLEITFRDAEGQNYTEDVDLGVTATAVERSSQITLQDFRIAPESVTPGGLMRVRLTAVNTGNQRATNVIVRLNGEGVLLAGPQGDTFIIGDLEPGESRIIDMPLIVSPEAKEGPRAQNFTVTHQHDGDVVTSTQSTTINIVVPPQPRALLVLKRYTSSVPELEPGMRFQLTAILENLGDGSAGEAVLTFGTVTSSGGSGGSGDGGSGSGGSSTSTNPSTTFAPLETGGRIFIGSVDPFGEVTLVQEFIVGGSVTTGVYTLPITIEYTQPSGSSVQETINASLVVIVPPRLTITEQPPAPPFANVGEPFPVGFQIINGGRSRVDLIEAEFEVEGGEIFDGASTRLESLDAGADTSFVATISGMQEGEVKVIARIRYLNELNQVRTIEREALVSVAAPPPFEPPIDEPPPFEPPPPTPEPPQDVLGRLLLALLGLGS